MVVERDNDNDNDSGDEYEDGPLECPNCKETKGTFRLTQSTNKETNTIDWILQCESCNYVLFNE
jgi:DNA-directed RNA polymerase subunit M/transcription elongation factor TFIIS